MGQVDVMGILHAVLSAEEDAAAATGSPVDFSPIRNEWPKD